ncbi:MAG TPA: hypothetical protein VFS97_05850 [Nitrososphaeraceae archaeon]|nr:hypothetical protein [Nitrososphaeraceae archaeon]
MVVRPREDMALALLLVLSDNFLEPARFNAVFYQIDKDEASGI